ncbi:hypothetical protein [Streptomyces sp. NPDC101132]|uniref:hypothetical protein n=1 Tax=Streptomyces sp. NPDC101132 TaxID=3366110 RepID=UPI003804AEEE
MTITGGLLLCRTDPRSVRPSAHLLREPLLLAPAGRDWTALVPEGKPWRDAGEPLDDVLSGWATAIAVGAPWPAIGLWWNDGETGFAVAAGFRRTVTYAWRADGTPAGAPDTMRILAARFGLDPVLDLEDLERLTKPDPSADGRARLLGLTALLARAGLALPPGLTPGGPAGRLREAARTVPGTETVDWSGWRDAVESGPLGPWLRGPRARALGAAQLAAGLPLLAWSLHRRSPGWATAGAVLTAHGTLSLAYPHRPRP